MAESRRKTPVVIEFRKSRSPYFRGVLRKARKYGRYELTKDDQGELHRILIGDRRTLLGITDVVESIRGWKHARILCEGEPVPFKQALWIIRCAIRRSSTQFSNWPCDKGKHLSPEDPFAYWCTMVEFGSRNRPGLSWWDYGDVDEGGIFRIDRMALRLMLEESIKKNHLRLCPYFDRKAALQAVLELPQGIDPRREKHWCYTWTYQDGERVIVGIQPEGAWIGLPDDPELAAAIEKAQQEVQEGRLSVRRLLGYARKDWKDGQA